MVPQPAIRPTLVHPKRTIALCPLVSTRAHTDKVALFFKFGPDRIPMYMHGSDLS